MRCALLLLTMFLLASMPAEASEGRGGNHPEYALPPLQWNASVDIGYISTAPLVAEGLVIVKGGGDPMTGDGAGLAAFRADTGEEVWRALHGDSTAGFEVAPLIRVPGSDDSTDCGPPSSLIVTGWSSGILTAHHLENGSEAWNISTPAPTWGINGGGYAWNDRVYWPTETGVVRICPANGTVDAQHLADELRTYRAGLGYWIGGAGGVTLGTESGHLLVFDANLNLSHELDLVAAANLSGPWRIRSVTETYDGFGIFAHLHGEGQSLYTFFDWNGSDENSLQLNSSLSLGAGTATTAAGFPYTRYIGTNDGVSIHFVDDNGSLILLGSHESTNVVGELRTIIWGDFSALCIPQNTPEGSWTIAFDANHSVNWVPDVPGYLTAGCGSDYRVLAVANDASWLEVRYPEQETYDIQREADDTLGIEPVIDEIPERTEEGPEVETKLNLDESDRAVIWLPIIGAGILFLIALIAPQNDLRRQIFAGASVMLLLGLILAASVYSQALVEGPVPDSSDRTRASDLHDWDDEENTVYVAFHYPEDFAPAGCDNSIRWMTTGGTSLQTSFLDIAESEGSHCIDMFPIEIGAASTVEAATADALYSSRLNFLIEEQTMGPFLRDVGYAEGGEDNRWWTFDLNGGYGTLGMAEQVVVPGDEIDWHFDVGQF